MVNCDARTTQRVLMETSVYVDPVRMMKAGSTKASQVCRALLLMKSKLPLRQTRALRRPVWKMTVGPKTSVARHLKLRSAKRPSVIAWQRKLVSSTYACFDLSRSFLAHAQTTTSKTCASAHQPKMCSCGGEGGSPMCGNL
jgi:hypothetical protein